MTETGKTVNNKQKSAAVMVALGAEHAAKVYKHLKDDEIEALTLEVAMMQRLDNDSMEDILNEFYEMCLAQKFIIEGGEDYARDALEKAFGSSSAHDILEKVRASLGTRAFDFLKKIDPRQLFNFIQNEHPQVIALIVAHATRLQASTVLGMLTNEKQVEVVERLARMDRISPDIIKEVEEALRKRLANLAGQETEIGGVKFTAELLNAVDRNSERYIFDELGNRDRDLADEIRKLMFVFEDIISLDDRAMQELNRNVEQADLIIALKNASDDLKEAFLANMSARVAAVVQEEMEYLRSVRARDVEAAQQRIVAKVRELEEQGIIILAHGRDDEFV